MKSLNNHELALELIKNDYINYRFIAGLGSLGIDASIYYLRLHEPICQLAGVVPCEEVYERYFDLMSQAEQVDLASEQALCEVAERVYEGVLTLQGF